MTTNTVPARPAASVRPPIWRLAAVSFLDPNHRDRVDAVLRRLPMLLILTAQTLLTVRLSNSAFQDEALYINGGHALIAHWLVGTPTGNPGDYFSGAPAAYPVLAGLLDNVGGLGLVRLFSLLCMLVTTVLVRSVTTKLFSARAGILAAAAFAMTGPVIFLGGFATFDAICVACIALAIRVGLIARPIALTAFGVGAALAAAATFKYTGVVFILPVICLIFLANGAGRAELMRAFGILVTTFVLLSTALIVWGDTVAAGIAFTTTSRKALYPAAVTELLGYLLADIGILAALAVGSLWFVRRQLRPILVALCLLAAGSILPVGQLRLGEAVSFEKHLAYSALFLAPLAGAMLDRISHRGPRLLGVFAILFVLMVNGMSRSLAMYNIWPDVSQVTTLVSRSEPAGRSLSTSSDALQYYLHDDYPTAQWDSQYGIFGAGQDAIRQAVTNGDYQFVIFRSGSSGNATEDANVAVLKAALDADPKYALMTQPFPTRQYATEDWYLYQRK